jgi:hypothetical protein
VGGSGTYFTNGFDIVRVLAAYDRSARTLYLGMRVAGVVGDSDGDGTPNSSAICTPPLNPGEGRIQDPAGIGVNEGYTWALDVNCDGKPDIYVRVEYGSNNYVTATVTGATTGAPVGAYYGSDLELGIPEIDLPLIFSVSGFSGSNYDGLSEDATNQVRCGQPSINIELSTVATPPEICAGATTTLSFSVKNTGEILLTTTDR